MTSDEHKKAAFRLAAYVGIFPATRCAGRGGRPDLKLLSAILLLRFRRMGAKYCYEYVCYSACVSACLSVCPLAELEDVTFSYHAATGQNQARRCV